MRKLKKNVDLENDRLLAAILRADLAALKGRGNANEDAFAKGILVHNDFVTMQIEPDSHHSVEWKRLMEIGEERQRLLA